MLLTFIFLTHCLIEPLLDISKLGLISNAFVAHIGVSGLASGVFFGTTETSFDEYNLFGKLIFVILWGDWLMLYFFMKGLYFLMSYDFKTKSRERKELAVDTKKTNSTDKEAYCATKDFLNIKEREW